ncbi:MAG: hypothetical protein HQM01_13840 [Magnetococcales bacterium]|nr:hypothetical protein [Magnetococcales bacterium]
MQTELESQTQQDLTDMAQLMKSVSPTSNPRTQSTTRTIIMLALATLVAAGTARHVHQSQPITDQQVATLSALVDRHATRTGQSRQKVWSQVHRKYAVRRASDIKRGDFDAVMRDLLI